MPAPASTPMAVAATRAEDAATKTATRLPRSREAKSMVASCVLSPGSARNTMPNTVANDLRSISPAVDGSRVPRWRGQRTSRCGLPLVEDVGAALLVAGAVSEGDRHESTALVEVSRPLVALER